LWLRSRAYLVTEFLPGPDIIERFAPYVESGARRNPSCRRWINCSPD
jgi:hypothetical protein